MLCLFIIILVYFINKPARVLVQKKHKGYQARVREGAQGAWAPPLEIEKQKKKKKVIRANFKLFHLYFATFLVGNIIFSDVF